MKLPRPGSSHFGPQHLICGLCLQKRTTRSSVMAFSRVLAVSLAVAALGENHTCGVDGECNDEESSLMQNFLSRESPIVYVPQTQWWSGMKGFANCRNRVGDEFPCGETGRCCGDLCAGEGDICCQNTLGNDFACAGDGGGCCGNACYAKGSKCCRVGKKSQWYPVAEGTDCAEAARAPKKCTNRFGDSFECNPGDRCCGDICVSAGGKCCFNANGNSFACGSGSTCCGNACAAAGSKCCKVGKKREWYPVSEATKCRE